MKNFLLNILLQNIPNESLFRTSGKIYIVVGIIAIIFMIIVLYLFRLDKKIAEIENK